MWTVLGSQFEILLRHSRGALRRRAPLLALRKRPKTLTGAGRCENLVLDLEAYKLGKRAGHSISKLPLSGAPIAINDVSVRKRLKATEFSDGEQPALPMERARGGTRFRLNRPGRPVFCQFQEKRPISSSPAEEWLPSSLRRMPEVVFPLWNARYEPGPFSRQIQVVWPIVHIEVTDCIPRGPVRLEPIVI